ncbi:MULTISPECIES: hypothetical protein [Vibrio]|uniref:Uncharacterized protein n=1 Tax=Vibrio paracholerae TaxID=650003 RepID=A0AAX1QQV9_9VIBR|nr:MULTISPECIES: hypothetical protein [Vibrio]MBY3674264.1 hypothetical protein [Vibrio cholerae]RBM52078.1 hypothetical protein DLR69_15335 [Vibrio paracholerae]RBM73808.1 hypothetical protein DLR70_17770 [Vibrio paracholerae]TQP54629.1 hypothetical protein FLL95_18150 [Vibrio cholerae]
MKSRELHTTPVLIVTNYQIIPEPSGKFLHTFTPENTPTIYKFIANQEPAFEEGARYNIGYEVRSGENWVDVSASAKADAVDPKISHYVARQLGEQSRLVETTKSDERVVHKATDGHYLGRKYAWRIYGMALSRDTFDDYLAYVKHPTVSCSTDGSASIAYKDQGIEELMDKFINSLVKVGKSGNRFKTSLWPTKRWFTVKGISAITDKK